MPGLAADLTDGAEAVHNCGLERSWERKIVPSSTGKSVEQNNLIIIFFFFLVKCSSEKGGRVERGIRSVTDCEQSIEITHYLRTSLKADSLLLSDQGSPLGCRGYLSILEKVSF